MASPARALPETAADRDAKLRIHLSWAVKLRWAAIAGQVVTIVIVDRAMGIALPIAELAAVVLLELAANAALVVWIARGRLISEPLLGASTAFDTLVLTALLYLTGGPFNPFSLLYVVPIALAAVTLRGRWTWALVGLSLACSALLFVHPRELAIPASSHAEHMAVHLRGMWVAFGVTASFIVYFLMRVVGALADRESALADAGRRAARQDKLAALATLAAGAAHELATPLGTIAVVAKELERQLPSADGALADDVRLIRAQVERCRSILERMAADAGESAGEMATPLSTAAIVAAATSELDASGLVVELDESAADPVVLAPARALGQAMRALIRNAVDASPAGAAVQIGARRDGDALVLEVRDRGAGMSPDVLARAGEPFFTTKSPGRGMGLGLFLARALVERLGGELTLDSKPGEGSVVEVRLPIAPAARPGSLAGGRAA